MINKVSYKINTTDGLRHLTITPVNTLLPTGDYFSTGVYKLSEGVVGMGDITFDDDMANGTAMVLVNLLTKKPKKWLNS